jgi:predicted DNA-binding transcriptional regulator AlpA
MTTQNESDADKAVRPDRLLRTSQVSELTTYGPHRLRILVKEGKFPAPVMLGRRFAFRESEVYAWMSALKPIELDAPWTPDTQPISPALTASK